MKKEVKKEKVFTPNQRPVKLNRLKNTKNHIVDRENKYNLFLDDFRIPSDAFNYTNNPVYNIESWVIVRNYDQFVDYITKNDVPEIISFDHDLSDIHYSHQNTEIPYEEFSEKTGYHCAKWLIYYCLDNKKELPKIILIHSMNVVGKQNIESLFKSFNKIQKNGNY